MMRDVFDYRWARRNWEIRKIWPTARIAPCAPLPAKRKRPRKEIHRPSREMAPTIRCLSNWQRNQWARAGYPRDVGLYLAMVHP